MTRKVTGRTLAAPPTWWAASVAPNVGAVAAATMPRRRHPADERAFPPGQLGPDGGGEGYQRAGHQHQDGHQAEGGQHQVLERGRGRDARKSTPMISCTRVSKNGRLARTSKARRFATASPIKIAAMSPASSRALSQTAATPTTHAS